MPLMHGTSYTWDYSEGMLCLVVFLTTLTICSLGVLCIVEQRTRKGITTDANSVGADPVETVSKSEPERSETADGVDTEEMLVVPLTHVFIGLLDLVSSCEECLNSTHETEHYIPAYDSALRSLFYFMRTIEHPNTNDLNRVCQILSQENHPESEKALQWLLIARHIWRTQPDMRMLTWDSHVAASVPEQELPKEC